MDMHQSESPHPISIFPTTQGADDLVAVDQEERLPSHTDAEAAPDAYEERRAFVNEIEGTLREQLTNFGRSPFSRMANRSLVYL